MVAAIFDGYHPARLIVDDAAQPRAGFIWMPGRAFLVGNPADRAFGGAVAAVIAGEIVPAMQSAGHRYFRFHVAPETWEGCLPDLIPGNAKFVRAERQAYAITPADPLPRRPAPPGIAIQSVDAGLLADMHLANHDRLVEEVRSSNPSLEAFAAHGFGVCARDGGTLAGWCLSENDSGGRCEVGIETVEDYRRRGIGAAMTAALIAQAWQRGLTQVGWHCWTINTASVATALKAGLRKVCDYPVFVMVMD